MKAYQVSSRAVERAMRRVRRVSIWEVRREVEARESWMERVMAVRKVKIERVEETRERGESAQSETGGCDGAGVAMVYM